MIVASVARKNFDVNHDFAMVVLRVKRDQEALFILETSVAKTVSEVLQRTVELNNGRLKVMRLADELADLAAHGVALPPPMRGLLEDQIKELKLSEPEEGLAGPAGGHEEVADPLQRRCGRAPVGEAKDALEKASAEAKKMVSRDNVAAGVALDRARIKEALDIVRGAVGLAYPSGLPVYDPVRLELENREELEPGSVSARDILDPTEAVLWFANKQMKREEPLSKYVGRNEKTKAVVKVSTVQDGRPTSEPAFDEETKKRIMLEDYKRMEELKRLERDTDDSYLNSAWADGASLKRKFNGLENISWKP